jgi:exonuclease VII small subunit
MIKEYIGSIGNRHNLTRYTLSNGVEVVLNEQEEQELFENSQVSSDKIEELEEHIEFLNEEIKGKRDFEEKVEDLEGIVSNLEKDIISLRNQNKVLETKLEKYKETIKSFKAFQEQLSKLKV